MTQHRSKSQGDKKKDPELDLSIGQVLAATGATTLGALLVKLLDIWGTILGMAVLSIFTSIGAVLILRTMRRTSERVKAQITILNRAAATRLENGRTVDLSAETVQVAVSEAVEPEAAAEADASSDEGDSGSAHSRRRTLLAILISSVTVFALTMLALLLFGTLTSGNPGEYLGDPQTTTVYVDDDQDTTDDTPGESATEDEAETETPTDEPTEDSTEETSAETPTDEATDESPTGETDTGSGGGEDASEAPTTAPEQESAIEETPAAE